MVSNSVHAAEHAKAIRAFNPATHRGSRDSHPRCTPSGHTDVRAQPHPARLDPHTTVGEDNNASCCGVGQIGDVLLPGLDVPISDFDGAKGDWRQFRMRSALSVLADRWLPWPSGPDRNGTRARPMAIYLDLPWRARNQARSHRLKDIRSNGGCPAGGSAPQARPELDYPGSL